MAAWIVIEEERGTYVGTPRHPHNGYYAGDFRSVRADASRRSMVARRTGITSPGSGA
jgi:hypothetical protein